jgi:hypothetical protein
MSELIWSLRPVSGLRATQVAQATRSLEHQGRTSSGDRVQQALWAVRALPVAIDALADARAHISLDRLRLEVVDVADRPATEGRMWALALLPPETSEVHVHFFSTPAGGPPQSAGARVRFAFSTASPDSGGDVVIQRFVHGGA